MFHLNHSTAHLIIDSQSLCKFVVPLNVWKHLALTEWGLLPLIMLTSVSTKLCHKLVRASSAPFSSISLSEMCSLKNSLKSTLLKPLKPFK